MAEEEKEQVSFTEEQVMEELERLAGTATVPDEKHNVHSFINAVATSADTTKVGNLKEEEVGIPTLSQRTLKELSLYCEDIAGEKEWANYLNKRAEILTSTSLSKEAKLIELAIVNRQELRTGVAGGGQRKQNKGWFGKKEDPAPAEV